MTRHRADFVLMALCEELRKTPGVRVDVNDDSVDDLVAKFYAPHAYKLLNEPDAVSGINDCSVEVLRADDEEFDVEVQVTRNCEHCMDELREFLQGGMCRLGV